MKLTVNKCIVSETDIISDVSGQLKFISRNNWIAQPPEVVPIQLELPSTRVIIAHTATKNCSTQVRCYCALTENL